MNKGKELKPTIEVLLYYSQTTDHGILYAVLLCAIVLVQCFYSASFKEEFLHINCCSAIQVDLFNQLHSTIRAGCFGGM